MGLCSLRSRKTLNLAHSGCLVNVWMRDSIKQWVNQCCEHRMPEAHHPCIVTSHRSAAKHRAVINWSPDTWCQQVPKEASAKSGIKLWAVWCYALGYPTEAQCHPHRVKRVKTLYPLNNNGPISHLASEPVKLIQAEKLQRELGAGIGPRGHRARQNIGHNFYTVDGI